MDADSAEEAQAGATHGDEPEQTPAEPDEPAELSADDEAELREQEAELRARLEERLREVTVPDLVLESIASIISLTARRIVKEDERDLAQARVGIDAVKALAEVLGGEIAEQLRPTISELQLLYARHAGGGGSGSPAGAEPGAEEASPGGAESPLRPPERKLWTPG